jgi:hypothetical protein
MHQQTEAATSVNAMKRMGTTRPKKRSSSMMKYSHATVVSSLLSPEKRWRNW